MDRITVTAVGTKAMQARLNGMSTSVQGAVMRPIVAQASDEVRGLAVQLAPKRTGAGRRGIISDLMKIGKGYCYYWVRLDPEVYYMRFQEFGLGTGNPKGSSARVRRRQANYEHSVAVRQAITKAWAKSHGFESFMEAIAASGLSRRELKRQKILAKGGNLQGQRRPNMAAQPFLRPAVRFLRPSISTEMIEGIAANILRWTE
jgi:HK97 gp10 family phage protein